MVAVSFSPDLQAQLTRCLHYLNLYIYIYIEREREKEREREWKRDLSTRFYHCFFKGISHNIYIYIYWETETKTGREVVVLLFVFYYTYMHAFKGHTRCNGNCRRKLTRQPEFKSWTWLLTLHIALMTLRKVCILHSPFNCGKS